MIVVQTLLTALVVVIAPRTGVICPTTLGNGDGRGARDPIGFGARMTRIPLAALLLSLSVLICLSIGVWA